MKLLALALVLSLTLLLSAQTDAHGPTVAPSSCATVQPPIANMNIICHTNDPASPEYLSTNGGPYQPLVGAASTVTSVNGRTGTVKVPIGGATLQCATITGTITIGPAGAVTITNAIATGCNL